MTRKGSDRTAAYKNFWFGLTVIVITDDARQVGRLRTASLVGFSSSCASNGASHFFYKLRAPSRSTALFSDGLVQSSANRSKGIGSSPGTLNQRVAGSSPATPTN